MPGLYLEDFTPGRRFGGAPAHVPLAALERYDAAFGPRPGEAASPWCVASLTMRLLVDSDMRPEGGIVGAGIEELRWPLPVRAGDALRVECEVLDARASRSRPHQGLVRARTETLNQHGQTVQVLVSTLVVPRREAG